jgi:glyoxylase-like metal-dependent hydrolase (beta-lactamase superfamily II)
VTRVELPGNTEDIVGIRAANPSPFSLTGTNTWIVGRDPAWMVDPGPALAEHLDALTDELRARGGLGGFVLTHDHFDHSEAVPAVRERFPDAKLGAFRGQVDTRLGDGDRFGPFEAVATPGHAPDHLTYIVGDVGLTGDAVLGEGSVFVFPDPGALAGYLEGLRRLQTRSLRLIGPGHGPVVLDPAAKLDEYIAHRLERERRLVEALDSGLRSADELLDAVWDDAPAILRPAAAVTLAAHLDKLAEEGRLPPGVERPEPSGIFKQA